MTFVKHGETCYAITNQHVTGDVGDLQESDVVFLLALERHTPLPGVLVATSDGRDSEFPYDISVFRVDGNVVVKGGKTPLDVSDVPSKLKQGDLALAVGFPGEGRTQRALGTRHETLHLVAECVLSNNRKIIMHGEFDGQPSDDVRLGGISGGPIYAFHPSGEYSLVGIVAEGKSPRDTNLRGAGTEYWVIGFPFSSGLLNRLIETQ